jgi:hypothetical protein
MVAGSNPAGGTRSNYVFAVAGYNRAIVRSQKVATRKGGAALGRIIAAPDPAQAFREGSLMAQRAVIDALCTVRLRRAAEGRLKRDHTRREVIDRAPSTSNGGERITYPAS